jgi:hypothetical protein
VKPSSQPFCMANNGATFSKDRRRRRRLWRTIVDDRDIDSTALWVMLNPSSAGADKNDATLRRVIGFTKSFGCNRVVIVNLCDIVSTNPRGMVSLIASGLALADDAANAFITESAKEIADAESASDVVVLAWGALDNLPTAIRGDMQTRSLELVASDGPLRAGTRAPFKCLGTTASGQPLHPLFLPATTPLQPWVLLQ